jgi:hypothetical protein
MSSQLSRSKALLDCMNLLNEYSDNSENYSEALSEIQVEVYRKD